MYIYIYIYKFYIYIYIHTHTHTHIYIYYVHYNTLQLFSYVATLLRFPLLQLGWHVGQNHFPFGLFLILRHFMWNHLISQLTFSQPTVS